MEFEEDTMVVLEVNPASGWFFKEWLGDDKDDVSNNNGEWKILMNGYKEITAYFMEEADITVNPILPITTSNFHVIQNAIQAANNGDVIEVAEDTYCENVNITSKSFTLRSTNPLDPAVRDATIIDGGANNSVIVYFNNAGGCLKGFTIQNGNASDGGGIYIHTSSPIIEYNNIITNESEMGGGINNAYSSSIIRYNKISNNEATNTSSEGCGGGIFNYDSDSEIYENEITYNDADNLGGGIFVERTDATVIEENIINHNMANYGGGIYIVSCSPTVNKNWIEANDSIIGGGIGIHAYNTTDSALPVISDNYLYENWAELCGGGIYINQSFPEIYGNSIWYNESYSHGGGIGLENSSEPIIYNNSIQNNEADGDEDSSGFGGGIFVDSTCEVKDAGGTYWPRDNNPPNDEPNNTYDGNTHSSGDGADVFFEND